MKGQSIGNYAGSFPYTYGNKDFSENELEQTRLMFITGTRFRQVPFQSASFFSGKVTDD